MNGSQIILAIIIVIVIVTVVMVAINSKNDTENPINFSDPTLDPANEIWLDHPVNCGGIRIIPLVNDDIVFRANTKYVFSSGNDMSNIPEPTSLPIQKEVYTMWEDGMLTKQDPTDSGSMIEIGNTGLVSPDIAFGLDGKLYAFDVFDFVDFANYGPASFYELNKTNGNATLLAELEFFTGKFPAGICAGPDGLLYCMAVTLQTIGGIGYSDWPSNLYTINPQTFEVTDLGVIGGNFGWAQRDLIIYNNYIYFSGYKIPSYERVVSRFPVTDPSQYEELLVTGPYTLETIYGIAIVGNEIWVTFDDQIYKIDPDTGAKISGSETTFIRDNDQLIGMTSIESIASIGAYTVQIEEFQPSSMPVTITTEQALNVINYDPNVNFTYLFLPANTGLQVNSDFTWTILE